MGNEQGIMMLALWWALLAVGMVIFFRRFFGSNKTDFPEYLTTPIDTLKSRCSRNDIREGEFDRR